MDCGEERELLEVERDERRGSDSRADESAEPVDVDILGDIEERSYDRMIFRR